MPRPTKVDPRRVFIGGFADCILSTTCLSDGSESSKCLLQNGISRFAIFPRSQVKKESKINSKYSYITRCKDALKKINYVAVASNANVFVLY